MLWKQNGHFPWASRCLYPRAPAESTCVTSAFPERYSRKWGSNTTPPSDVNSSSRCTPNKPLTFTVKAHWTCLKDFKNERTSVWMLQQNWNFSVCIFLKFFYTSVMVPIKGKWRKRCQLLWQTWYVKSRTNIGILAIWCILTFLQKQQLAYT